MRLVVLGVPYEAAAKLSPAQRLGYIAVLTELHGKRFDWSRLTPKRK